MAEYVLHLDHVTMQFGGVVAVKDLDLEVRPREIVGLIGPNGAGKTTAFNMVTGVYTPTRGQIHFAPDGKDQIISGKKPEEVADLGICRTFQNIRLFRQLSVEENVRIASNLRMKSSWAENILRFPRYQKEVHAIAEEAERLLREVDLLDQRQAVSSSLPYGKQRRLEIARALATHPQLLLLDEPAAGMNPQETKDLMNFIESIRDQYNLTIFLIEHHMDVIMGICDRIYVLDHGELIANGVPEEIQNNPRVVEAYLGVD